MNYRNYGSIFALGQTVSCSLPHQGYIHAFSNHVPEFIQLYGNLISFTQQGLEKINNVSTKQFQRASNHRGIEALIQMLEKRNHLETLEGEGHARVKKM